MLGHRNKDSIRKTVTEMGGGLVWTRGVLKTCKHCVMIEAKQNNVRKESVAKKATIQDTLYT